MSTAYNKPNSKIFSTFSIAAFLVVVGFGFSSLVHANDAKVFNGSGCDSYFAADADKFDRVYNGIRNIWVGSLWVTCPVTRDEEMSTAGLDYVLVQFMGSGTFQCQFHAFNSSGTSFVTASASRSGQGNLTISPFANPYRFGTYNLLCKLPPNGALNRYSIDERP